MKDRPTSIKRDVEAGYDAMAERYLGSKDPNDAVAISSLKELAKMLPEDAKVLDLGCGAGVPATRWLSERFRVIGVDISEKQLELARTNVPNATLVKADMTTLNFSPNSFDAVVALLSIIHVPKDEQPALFRNIHRWLRPGGCFFGILSVGEWEGFDPDWEGWGAGMWWSHHDAGANLAMLRDAGFHITRNKKKTDSGTGSGKETWLHVLAHKSVKITEAGTSPLKKGIPCRTKSRQYSAPDRASGRRSLNVLPVKVTPLP